MRIARSSAKTRDEGWAYPMEAEIQNRSMVTEVSTGAFTLRARRMPRDDVRSAAVWHRASQAAAIKLER